MRIFKDLLARPFFFYFSVYHKENFVGNGFGKGHFMRHNCHGHIFIGKSLDGLENFSGQFGIEIEATTKVSVRNLWVKKLR